MRRTTAFLTASLALALCLTALAVRLHGQQRPKPPAQPEQAQSQNDQGDERVTTFIRRVRLPITVLDKKGQPVSGLTAQDFLVMEDKKPQTIETFSDESESFPVYVGVLMDTSPSTAGKLKFEQESAKNFI